MFNLVNSFKKSYEYCIYCTVREDGSVFSVLSALILKLHFTHLSLFCNYLVITSVIIMYMNNHVHRALLENT